MLHLPSHEGYIVKNPTSIFRKLSPFLLMALETFKESLAISGANSPFATAIGTAASVRVEYSLRYLEEIRFQEVDEAKIEAGSKAEYERLRTYLAGVETWDKAIHGQIEPHLIPSGTSEFLGDMFRMLTENG